MARLKWPIALAVALAVGAYMSLGDLVTSRPADAGDGTPFVLLSGLGILALVALIGWHTLWLLPLVAQLFAWTYERWFWDKPEGIGRGMDFLGYYPSSVGVLMVFAVPFAGLLALLRSLLLGRSMLPPAFRRGLPRPSRYR